MNPFSQVATIVLHHVVAADAFGTGTLDELAEPDLPRDVGRNCIVKIHSSPSPFFRMVVACVLCGG
jgi:hypothetical protein